MMTAGTKFCGAVACFSEFVHAASKAAGIEPQTVYSPQVSWLWWFMAVGWVFITSQFIYSLWTGK